MSHRANRSYSYYTEFIYKKKIKLILTIISNLDLRKIGHVLEILPERRGQACLYAEGDLARGQTNPLCPSGQILTR